jgi:hypothetical protein
VGLGIRLLMSCASGGILILKNKEFSRTEIDVDEVHALGGYTSLPE